MSLSLGLGVGVSDLLLLRVSSDGRSGGLALITPDNCQLLDCQPVYPDYLVPFHGHLSLRAPPVI